MKSKEKSNWTNCFGSIVQVQAQLCQAEVDILKFNKLNQPFTAYIQHVFSICFHEMYSYTNLVKFSQLNRSSRLIIVLRFFNDE